MIWLLPSERPDVATHYLFLHPVFGLYEPSRFPLMISARKPLGWPSSAASAASQSLSSITSVTRLDDGFCGLVKCLFGFADWA